MVVTLHYYHYYIILYFCLAAIATLLYLRLKHVSAPIEYPGLHLLIIQRPSSHVTPPRATPGMAEQLSKWSGLEPNDG